MMEQKKKQVRRKGPITNAELKSIMMKFGERIETYEEDLALVWKVLRELHGPDVIRHLIKRIEEDRKYV